MLNFPIIMGIINLLAFIFVYNYDTPTYVYFTTQNPAKTFEILKKLYNEEKSIEELRHI